jgi:hypothetical protein
MAEQWRLKDYRTQGGAWPFREWYAVQPPAFQAAFDITVSHLKVTAEWTDKAGAKDLKREHVPLTELLIDLDVKAPGPARLSKRRFRPVGVKIIASREFLFLGGAEKSGGVYEPLDAFDRALKHWRDFDNGLGAADDHDV